MSNESVFKKLSEIDISSMVRQKGQFWYMPWSNAVREVAKNYPDFYWDFTTYGEHGLPYLKTDLGYFVECSVVIEGKCRKQMMPVLDFKNQTNMSPKANDINKAQMRALAKAISLHGLGLDLWAGEDLIGWGEESQTVDKINQQQHDQLFTLLCDELGNYTEKGAKIAKAYNFELISDIDVSKFDEVLEACQQFTNK